MAELPGRQSRKTRSVSSAVNQAISDFLFARGYSVTKHVTYDEARALIRRLKPLDCGTELIRIGGDRDGGYLIPNDLEGMEYCFSPGVSTTADFENHLAELGIRSFMADYSVDSPPVHRAEFVFDKKFLGCTDDPTYFTFTTWFEKYLKGYTGDLLLQMDIEGSEYEVIMNIPDELLSQFRIVVIEFHEVQRLFEPFYYRLFDACLRKLARHFQVAHLHPNNGCGSARSGDIDVPRVLEVTLYNRRRITRTGDAVIPHALDRDNFPDKKPLHLPYLWYGE